MVEVWRRRYPATSSSVISTDGVTCTGEVLVVVTVVVSFAVFRTMPILFARELLRFDPP
jgi:hypothetical protein